RESACNRIYSPQRSIRVRRIDAQTYRRQPAGRCSAACGILAQYGTTGRLRAGKQRIRNGSEPLFMSERVLVTGASGFVGRRLVEYLKAEGSDVLAPDTNALDLVSGAFPDLSVEAVIHLAARTFVPDSWIKPGDFYRVNA